LSDEPVIESGAPDVDAHFANTDAELRRPARSRLRSGGRDEVLDTTALVHEVYLELSRSSGLSFPDRPRFLVCAGRVMRSIIVGMVRHKQSQCHAVVAAAYSPCSRDRP
jgi:hypothetical protein